MLLNYEAKSCPITKTTFPTMPHKQTRACFSLTDQVIASPPPPQMVLCLTSLCCESESEGKDYIQRYFKTFCSTWVSSWQRIYCACWQVIFNLGGEATPKEAHFAVGINPGMCHLYPIQPLQVVLPPKRTDWKSLVLAHLGGAHVGLALVYK